MIGFALLCAHLVGDYLLQSDWMAQNKANPYPGPNPLFAAEPKGYEAYQRWDDGMWKWGEGCSACIVHCLLYTLAIAIFTFPWMTVWGLLMCFFLHYVIDRYALARKWMESTSWSRGFGAKESPFWPWSIVVVDNTWHLLTLYGIALAHGVT